MLKIKVMSHPGRIPSDKFDEGFVKCTQDAVEEFEKNGEAPFFVVILGDESTEIIQWSDGGIPYGFIKQYFARKARAYYACFETWYVEAKTPDIECMPSEHPDRKEGLTVIGESRDGWQKMATWEIVRNGAGMHLVRGADQMGVAQSILAEVLWEETNAT